MSLRDQFAYVVGLAALVALLLTGCSPTAMGPDDGDEPDADQPIADQLPPEAVRLPQQWLADKLDVAVEDIDLISVTESEFSDSCLGLGGPAESCLAAITPGWTVIFEVDGERYEVRSGQSGQNIRSTTDFGDGVAGPPLPAAAVLKAQQWLADQLDVTTEDVAIVEMEQREWSDACLGLGGPAELCAAVITPGWLAIFEVNGEQYEVRTDETGDAIRTTADLGVDEDGMPLPPEAAVQAQQWLADQLEVQVEEVAIISQEQREWSDSCLGLGGPAEACLTVITPGWLVILEVDGRHYEVRTDESGRAIRSPHAGTDYPELEPLAGTSWLLNSYGPVGKTTAVSHEAGITLVFDEAGQLGGNGGCNSFGADYQVNGNTLVVGDIISTLKACVDDEVTGHETAYFNALRDAGDFHATTGSLTIWYDNGQSVLNFVSQ